MPGLGEYVIIVSRIIHVKVDRILNVTNKFKYQRRLSSRLAIVMFRGSPCMYVTKCVLKCFLICPSTKILYCTVQLFWRILNTPKQRVKLMYIFRFQKGSLHFFIFYLQGVLLNRVIERIKSRL